MPFTLAHPAAAIPFSRFGLPLAPLVIGSCVPDLPFFLELQASNGTWHYGQGFVVCCPAAGMVLLFFFERLFKRPCIDLFPPSHRAQLLQFARPALPTSITTWVTTVAALFIGAATHVIWDSFTHTHGWAVNYLPLFSEVVFSALWGGIEFYKFLQYSCGVLGLIAMVYVYDRWHKRAFPADDCPASPFSDRMRQRLLLSAFAFSAACAAGYAYYSAQFGLGYRVLVSQFIVMSVTSLIFFLAVYSAVWQSRYGRRGGVSPTRPSKS